MQDSGKETSRPEMSVGSVESPAEEEHDTRPPYGEERVTFESYGNAKQQLYVRSDRLATERRGLEHAFGKGTYWERSSTRETGRIADKYAGGGAGGRGVCEVEDYAAPIYVAARAVVLVRSGWCNACCVVDFGVIYTLVVGGSS